MKKILYLTDLAYPAKGRNYSEEDIYITSVLKDNFDVILCHPQNAENFESVADLIVFRNTGSVLGYPELYQAFINRVNTKHLKTFNEFTGKADMCGKQYLLDLTQKNYPVIPTVDSLQMLHLLPDTETYVIKPKNGADSIGLKFLTQKQLLSENFTDDTMLIQPAVDFQYEVSFYFINNKLEYALYAPDKAKRWQLKRYSPTQKEIAFAETFIQWNTIQNGIQRVDACCTKQGDLLLVELEDLNPYLSLLELDSETRNSFLHDMQSVFHQML